MATTHGNAKGSLTLEDRCLLLALAVRQSAPLPTVASTACALQQALAPKGAGTRSSLSPAQSSFAGRGLRRRIQDVGAAVGSQDTVLFDRPAHGRAILEYVWDNYQAMREAMLAWLVQSAAGDSAADLSVAALSALVLRHGTTAHLTTLGAIARESHPDLLSAVLDVAVHDEHVGRLAWDILYRWAEQKPYAPTVAPDPASYGRLRAQLLPALRGHNMFRAGMELMKALTDVTTPQGVNAGEDFYQHLVDHRLQPVFSLTKAPV
ncbi:hypothetical protein KBP30_40985 [Streptomyces sp. Go40/10]|uniref:hypothetical protein n=1 Tax=Streptomyces sp. Go40/10 TaxID=2825844 RepID=UPI001E2ED4F5|nr:hypothetical protein [Streptomyces sp. Go40/10]UFR07123.1 hypothetical protein KBP30_40985 [Streptomyces sp. Go40/10]